MSKSMVGAIIGKIIATIFVAVCTVLGFGPKEWAVMILGIETVWLARLVFFALAAITLAILIGPPIWRRYKRNDAFANPTGLATPKKRPYTRVDVERRQTALNAIDDQINKIADGFATFTSFANANLNTGGAATYAKELEGLQSRLERAGSEMLDVVNRSGYEDHMRLAAWELQLTVHHQIRKMREMMEVAQQDTPPLVFQTKLAWVEYLDALKAVTHWISGMRSGVAAKRAEYEKAEVYQ